MYIFQAWWFMPITLGFGRLGQEDNHKSEASVDYTVSSRLALVRQ